MVERNIATPVLAGGGCGLLCLAVGGARGKGKRTGALPFGWLVEHDSFSFPLGEATIKQGQTGTKEKKEGKGDSQMLRVSTQ